MEADKTKVKCILRVSRDVVAAIFVLALVSAAPSEATVLSISQTGDALADSVHLSQAANRVIASDPSRAESLAENAQRRAEESHGDLRQRELAIATSQRLRGEALLRLNNPSAASQLLSQAYATVDKLQDHSALKADILISRARLESTTDQVQAALADYLAAFEIYKQVGDKHQQAVSLQDMGLLYNDAGDYRRALSYYGQSQTTFSGVPILDLSIANNRGDSLKDLGQYQDAESSYLSALKIAERMGSSSLQAQILSNLAVAQISDRRYAAAEASVTRGLKLAQSEAASALRPILLSTRAQLYLHEGRVADAESSINAIPDTSAQLASERDEWVHRTKYEVYKAQGRNRDALVELESFQKIQSGHRSLMSSANTALMAARFDFDNQNARISALRTGELKRDIALTRLRARQGQILLGGLLAIVTALIVFLVIYLRTLTLSHRRTRQINTELSESNAKLEDALQAKTMFLATTSHEIRTPLNGVLGMTEVLLAGGDLSEHARQRVALIHGAGEAMRALVDDLLDMSKMDAGQIVLQRDVVNFQALLGEIFRFWLTHAENAGLEMSLDLVGAPGLIVEDAQRLRQILSNLLSNAVKFTAAGSIVMSARARTVAHGEEIVICVSDSGIGIPEGSREMIFEKFSQVDASVTRKYGGTGLGLSIARTLARAMGGDITVKSNSANGADFFVILPLKRVAAEETTILVAREAAPALSDLRVVIVEANPITQGGLRSLLERRVDTISFSPTIKEAVDDIGPKAAHVVIASFPKGGRIPNDAADRDMAELARACRRAGVDLVVILDTNDLGGVMGLNLPGASYLERPISAASLTEQLESLHDLQRHLPALRA